MFNNCQSLMGGKGTKYTDYRLLHCVICEYCVYSYTVFNTTDIKYRCTASEVLPKPIVLNYDFLGWFDKDDNIFDFINTPITSDMVITAKWQDHKYNATFDAAEGRFPSDKQVSTKSFIYGELITYPTNPMKDGFEFKGYKLGTDDSYIPGGDDKYYNFSEDKTFIVYYEPWNYTITFDSNAPASPAGALNIVNGNMVDITDAKSTIAKQLTNNNYTLTGYTFIGWATASYTAPEAESMRDNHSDKIITDGSSVTFVFNEASQVVTLYALWTRNKYAIHIETNNTNVTIDDPYVADGYILYDEKFKS